MASTNNLANNNAPQNTVIVHGVTRAKTLPHPSPYVLKLETYLRMADIPYQFETKKPYGPAGKMPWISLDGEIVTDSELIIEFLNQKYDKNLWGNATVEEKAIVRALRISMEEHFVCGIIQWRFIQGIDTINQVFPISGLKLKLGKLIIPPKMKKQLDAQGLGRHNNESIVKLASEDLRDAANILGDKKFFLGDEPTEVDAALFGQLAQAVWGTPGSPYEELVNNELIKLKHYCFRMKDLFWNDWNKLLAK